MDYYIIPYCKITVNIFANLILHSVPEPTYLFPTMVTKSSWLPRNNFLL